MDKRPQRLAKNTTDLMPKNASCKRWDTLIGRGQGGLECRIQQLMTVLAQKHKEFSCLACAGSNFVFCRCQRTRWVPHRGLLQMGGACSSVPYKSIEPPVVSTLSELLSKQLLSVLAPGLHPQHGFLP